MPDVDVILHRVWLAALAYLAFVALVGLPLIWRAYRARKEAGDA